jgi:hypothetical protein
MRTRNLLLAAMALAGAQTVSTASAQSWEFDPRLQLGYEFNDNYRLDFPGNEIDVSGGLLDARLPVRLATPTRNVELSPRVRATLFPDEPDEDSTDYFFGGMFEQRTQRQVFGIDGSWSRQDVVRSELPNTEVDGNLGEPTTADAGRATFRNTRDQFRVQPYWHYDLSQRNRVEAGAYHLNADFENDVAAGEFIQQDFKDTGLYAGWGYAYTQRSRLTFRGRASRYETTFDSEAFGAEVEWRSDYTQNANIYLRVGSQKTEQDRVGGWSDTSIIAGAGGRWNWPTTNLFADLTRSVGPNASGSVIARNELRLRVSRAVRPRFSIIAGARASRDEAIDTSTFPDRDYLTGEVGFDWRFTRAWSLMGEYRYIWQEYSDEPSDTASNAITLGIVYQPGRGE